MKYFPAAYEDEVRGYGYDRMDECSSVEELTEYWRSRHDGEPPADDMPIVTEQVIKRVTTYGELRRQIVTKEVAPDDRTD